MFSRTTVTCRPMTSMVSTIAPMTRSVMCVDPRSAMVKSRPYPSATAMYGTMLNRARSTIPRRAGTVPCASAQPTLAPSAMSR